MGNFPRKSSSSAGSNASGFTAMLASAAKANPEYETRFRTVCLLEADEALAELGTGKTGLSAEAFEDRQREFGPNLLSGEKRRGFFLNIFDRVKDPLVIQLLVICIVSLLMGDLRAAIVVGGMILISVLLAWFQEQRSSDAADRLKEMVQASAVVLREGKEAEVPMSDIVPGDIVVLAAGSIIPADLRILAAKDFYVSQSALTGESMPVEKDPSPGTEGTSTFSLPNACFQGSTVVSGAARGVAVNTGMRTFLGSVSAAITAPKDPTDFDKGLKSFVRLMVRLMLIMVSVTFLIVGLTKHNWVEALLFGLSVAVGLTPEMLPMIVTVCLSKGAIAMSKKKVIVKKLKAIQNLGAIDILCTDKTGTLTQDKVILEKHVDVTNRPSEDVLKYAYMNSYYQTGLRNLLDLSILGNEDLDVERTCRKVDEIPFDFSRKRMSVILDYESSHVLICKGSVEAIFQACDKYQIDDDIFPMIDVIRNDITEEYMRLSAQGYRVLAIAYGEFPNFRETFSVKDESGLILLGYLAFFDPPKDSAETAIKSLKDNGVRVKILTGDNELVTRKVCADVGLETAGVVTGKRLEGIDHEEFLKVVEENDVFAQLTPTQKEQIILGLKEAGHVVGFLGDGINDAPAMRAADVGISVDTAVDVAKESADIILLEKNLLVLEDGILEGRKLFNNIVKYIKMGASSNFGNMFSVVGGSYLLPFLPMAPIQILLNNLLYDVSQTGIPFDAVDPEAVDKPQSWNIGYIKKFMLFIGPISSIFDYATFALMLFFFNCAAWSHPGTTPEMRLYYEQLFHTGWFAESLLTQTLIVHIIRTNRIPFFQSIASFPMMLASIAVAAIAVALPYTPVAGFFGLVPLPATFWIWIAAFLVCYAVLTHIVKTRFQKHFGGRKS